MKRVLLLNPPAEKLYIRDYYCSFSSKAGYYWPPQDLLVLSGILSQYYDVRVLDCIASGTGIKRGTSIILSYDIDIVIFTTGTTSLKEDLEFARKIKEKKNVIIIASSAIFRFIGYEVMKENSFLDAVITDFVDHDIINYIENDFNNINSIICRKNGAIFNNNIKSLYSNAFYIPIPRHDLFEFRKYRLPTCKRLPFTVTITSKGCPFSCRFCTAGAVGHRLRDLSNIIEEMLLIKNLGVNELLFLDPSLTANKGHILELCKRIIEENIDITWSCNANVISVLEEDLLIAMKNAGCHTVMLGVESGDETILKKYSKNLTIRQIKDAFRLCKKHTFNTVGYFIIGLPGENRESILKTIKLAIELNCDFASFDLATADIGTKLREDAIKNKWISQDIFAEWDASRYTTLNTEKLDKDELMFLLRKAKRDFYLRPAYIFNRLSNVKRSSDFIALLKSAFILFR